VILTKINYGRIIYKEGKVIPFWIILTGSGNSEKGLSKAPLFLKGGKSE